MAVCIGCGLTVDPTTGLLKVQPKPGGGLDCDDAGVFVTFGDTAGAVTALQTALNTTNTNLATTNTNLATTNTNVTTAQTAANNASDSAAYRARLYGTQGSTAPIDLPSVAANTPLLVQGGSFAGSLDGSGNVVLTYPTVFPTACLSVNLTMGAGGGPTYPWLPLLHDSGTATAIQIKFWNPTTNAVVTGTGGVRFSWIAIGW